MERGHARILSLRRQVWRTTWEMRKEGPASPPRSARTPTGNEVEVSDETCQLGDGIVVGTRAARVVWHLSPR